MYRKDFAGPTSDGGIDTGEELAALELEAKQIMQFRCPAWVVMAALVTVVLAASAQAASAAGTLLQQHRLNEFTGVTDNFARNDTIESAVRAANSLPLKVAAAPECMAGLSAAPTQLCPGYFSGFSYGVLLNHGLAPVDQYAEDNPIIIEILIADAGRLRRSFDF